MRTNRQGIIVWFHRRRNIKQIKRYGHLIYASKRQNYAVLYVNQEDIDELENKLERQPFIVKTERSHKPFIRTDFENKEPEKTKPYDYNMGI